MKIWEKYGYGWNAEPRAIEDIHIGFVCIYGPNQLDVPPMAMWMMEQEPIGLRP
jgi:hypothetical protein